MTEITTTSSGAGVYVTTFGDGIMPLINQSGQTIGFVAAEQDAPTTPQTGEKPWSGILAVVGSPTSDQRFLIPGEISNRDLPIPLQVQTVTAEGHGGAAVAGRIDQIDMVPLAQFDQKDDYNLDGVPDNAIIVFGSGLLDGSEAALEAERLIANGAGISIDLPPDRMALIDPKTFEEVDPAEADIQDVLAGKYLTGIGGKIAAATIVTIPAFEEAEIELTEEESVLVASAYGQHVAAPLPGDSAAEAAKIMQALVASAAPLKPPLEWFENPGLKKLTPLTITPEGRVFGHLADWEGCHTGFTQICVPPFRSQSGYAYFNVAPIETADGSLIKTGKLMFDRDGAQHAPVNEWTTAEDAAKHYDDATKDAAYVMAGEDRYGTWLAGALVPGLSEEDVQFIRAHPPSGDWRPSARWSGSELIAAFCVSVPGFPIANAMVASAGADGGLTIITAPLTLELGPHAVRRRFEVLKRKRKSMRPYSSESELVLDTVREMTEDQLSGLDDFIEMVEKGLVELEWEELRDVSSAERKRLAKTGAAMPDGSFPIANCSDAENARRAIGRTSPAKRPAVERHIAKREKALGCSSD